MLICSCFVVFLLCRHFSAPLLVFFVCCVVKALVALNENNSSAAVKHFSGELVQTDVPPITNICTDRAAAD